MNERVHPGVPLQERYAPDAVDALSPAERRRIARCQSGTAKAWELLYALDADLYDRLVAGEQLHPGIVAWLPESMGTAVEVGAGTGRLTTRIAARCRRIVAVEPSRGMRDRLRDRLSATGARNADVCGGDLTALPLRDGCADVVLACATLTPEPIWGGEGGLAELERVCSHGGLVVIVWPHSPDWLRSRGYAHEVFDGDMAHEFASVEDALELARVFYPDRLDAVARVRSRHVPYEVLGINAPRDLAWKVVS
jgi:SAM-dependent methyltransferase